MTKTKNSIIQWWEWKRIMLLIAGTIILLFSLITWIYNWYHAPKYEIPKNWVSPEYIFGNMATFVYYSSLSDLFLGISMIFLAFFFDRKRMTIFFASIVVMSLTAFIAWFIMPWSANFENENTVGFVIVEALNHGVNPLIGFIAFIIVCKGFKFTWKMIIASCSLIFAYYLFMVILFFVTFKERQMLIDEKGKEELKIVKDGVAMYAFLNFAKPFFYEGSFAIALIINIGFMIATIAIPFGFATMWKYIAQFRSRKLKPEEIK